MYLKMDLFIESGHFALQISRSPEETSIDFAKRRFSLANPICLSVNKTVIQSFYDKLRIYSKSFWINVWMDFAVSRLYSM